jgi:tetratricopeptide (TPR) repeat protein
MMDKLLIFFLSVIVMLLHACTPKTVSYEHLSAAERKAEAEAYRAAQPPFYQGSLYKEEMFDTLQMIDPGNAYYWWQQSIPHTKIGDYHIAIPILEEALAIDPAETLYYYSWLLINNYHDFPRALQYLEQFDQLTPNQIDYAWGENVLFLKGLAHKELGQYAEAITEFTNCIEKEGKNVDIYTYVYRGITYLRMGEYEAAMADFDYALQDYPRCTMAHFYKGETLMKMGQEAAARQALEEARRLLKRGIKKTDPYKDVFDEVQEVMIDDLLNGSYPY